MPVSDYTPTVQDIAQMLRARTRNQAGDLVRDFTDDTLPTAEDVTGLINSAIDDVSGAIGADIPDEFFDTAKVLVVYLASANVELSYWPDQASATNSMYDKLMARYNAKLEQLLEELASETGEEDTGNPVDEFGINWNTLGGGFPEPIGWEHPVRKW
jgi:hypothetical protein